MLAAKCPILLNTDMSLFCKMFVAHCYFNKDCPLISIISPLILSHFIASTKLHFNIIFLSFFFHGATASIGPWPPHYRGFTITLRYTTLGMTPLEKWSAPRRDLCLTTLINLKRQTSMLPAGFKSTIPTNERPQTRSSDRATTRIGHLPIYFQIFQEVSVLHLLLPALSTRLCLFVLYVQPILPQQNIVKYSKRKVRK
jgi:hypothetical protein